MEHGPLRFIITTDEEQNQTGVKNLDAKYIKDVDYIINLDDEKEGEIVISSASGISFDYSGKLTHTKPTGDKGIEIYFSGLTGGHSGMEIDKGRMNAIMALGDLLQNLKKNNINFDIASILGGDAVNAIPTGVKAKLCISETQYDKFNDVCNKYIEKLKGKYQETDPDLNVEISEIGVPKYVVSATDKDNILTFFNEKNNGVYSMSEIIDGLVESSSNLGVIDVDAEKFSASGMIRSSDNKKENELYDLDKSLALNLGYKIEFERNTNAWPVKKNNPLEKLAKETYKELYSKELNVIAIHAGLECSSFAEVNPKASIISMGPTVNDSHTINECVEIESIEKTWNLLQGILAKI